MVDVFNEQLLSLAQVAKLLPPGRQGRPVNFSTIYRWIFTGVRAPDGERVKLEAIRLGGRYLVSREAIERFIERLSTHDVEVSTPPQPARTPTALERAVARADRSLEREGI
jgi:hypothetical protein